MRKSLFLASLAALTMLAACQKDVLRENTPNRPSNDVIDDSTPVAMTLSASAPTISTKVATRANGTVNAWDNTKHDLFIYSFQAGSASAPAAADYSKPFINNVSVDAPTAATPAISMKYPTDHANYPNEPYYYQQDNIYEFYGYYIDDALAAGKTATAAATGVTVPFVITGAQDLMIGRTDKSEDILADGTTPVAGVLPSRLYSAYSARRGVTPNLKFNHVLSRFTFDVQPGSTSAKDIQIEAITIKSYSKGTLNVVSATANTPDITVETGDVLTPLALAGLTEEAPKAFEDLATAAEQADYKFETWKDANVAASVKDKDKTNPEKYPEVLTNTIMVIPGEKLYELEVTLGWVDGNMKQPIEPIRATIDIEQVTATGDEQKGDVFEAGKSYNLSLVVYGPEEIKLFATLNPWKEIGTQVVDPDGDVKGYIQFLNKTETITAAAVENDADATKPTNVIPVYSDNTWTGKVTKVGTSVEGLAAVGEDNQSWLTIVNPGSTDTPNAVNAPLRYEATENLTATARYAEVEVTLGGTVPMVATVIVEQQRAALSATKVAFVNSEDLTAKTKINKNYTSAATLSVDGTLPNWVSSATFEGDYLVVVAKTTNESTTDAQTSTITVKDAANDHENVLPVSVTVERPAKKVETTPVTPPASETPVLTDLEDKTLEGNETGKKLVINFEVTPDAEVTVDVDYGEETDWMGEPVVDDEANTITFTTTATNDGVDAKVATVTVTPTGGTAKTFTITQPNTATPDIP